MKIDSFGYNNYFHFQKPFKLLTLLPITVNPMNKIIIYSLSLLLTTYMALFAEPDFQSNTLIVKVKSEYRNACSKNNIDIPQLQSYFESIGVNDVSKVFPNHQAPSTEQKIKHTQWVDLSLIYEIQFSSNSAIDKITKQLQKLNCLEYAEPRYNYQLAYVPNDTDVAIQFYHNNLKTYQAWDISKGDTNTVIGITDTGFDTSHVDLKNSFKKNYADPINGVDDDNDGYIDNFMGWDFGGNDNNPNPDACAVCNHGVHVAGICSATADNIAGIAGTGFKCKFLAIKIMNSSGLLVNGYEGIVYAADHNCKVVNCSWGGENGGQFGQDAINYATFNKNCLVIAAAGNYSNNKLFYPAAYDNVLCIAATDVNDVKWSNSNYGIYVDACAPGKDIVSTWPGNVYVPSSGTSMACPAASGCAAIVASYFPNYNALQIAERVKNTCDNIDTNGTNNQFINRLGHGRMNLYRALTDTELPALVTTAKQFTDGNDNAFVSGDTIRIKCNFKNYLAATTNLKAKFRTNSTYVTIIDSIVNLGAVSNLGDTSNFNIPFKVLINNDCPQNEEAMFTIYFEDGVYNANESFYIRLNVDYINLLENELGITITSTSLIGYNAASAAEGIGVDYSSYGSMLYEGGLMIAASATQVSDNVRGAAGSQDADFASVINVAKVIPSVVADAELSSVFNDDGAGATKINVDVRQQTYAWSSSGNNNFVILKYTIKNKNSNTLNNLFAGIFADWDVMNYNKNRTRLVANQKLSYAYSTEPNTMYAGIKLLSAAPFKHYAIDNVTGGAGGANLSDNYTPSEKYITLSNNRDSAGFTSAQGNDIADVVSTGPFNIDANDSTEVAFAIIGGLSKQEMLDGANAAQLKYDGIITDSFSYRGKRKVAIYPNPCSYCGVYVEGFVEGKTSLQILSMQGNIVFEKQLLNERENLHLVKLAQGVYIVKVTTDGLINYNKLVIGKEN